MHQAIWTDAKDAKRYWNHMIGIGIDSQTPANEIRQIVFLNAVVL